MIEIRFSRAFDADVRRLARFNPDLAGELRDVIRDSLAATGTVPELYAPHILNNRVGILNGCVEFHLSDDVLVLYSPQHPTQFVTMQRLCTHSELNSGIFNGGWPQ